MLFLLLIISVLHHYLLFEIRTHQRNYPISSWHPY